MNAIAAVIPAQSTALMPLSFIQRVHSIRPLNPRHVERIKRSMDENGVQPFPLRTTPDGVLFAGTHRYAAMQALGLTEALIHIECPASLDAAALIDNAASEQVLPMTFVDHAELVWRKADSGQTQQSVADELNWSRESVRNYAALQKIAEPAWRVIGTNFQQIGLAQADDGVPLFGTDVPFTEGLLRFILPLTVAARAKAEPFLAKLTDEEWDAAENPPQDGESSRIARLRTVVASSVAQQLGLVSRLARGKCSKGRPYKKTGLKDEAVAYQTGNILEIEAHVLLRAKIAGPMAPRTSSHKTSGSSS